METGSPIYYTGGAVGIGTTNPQYLLDVHAASGYAVSAITSNGSGSILRMLHYGAGINLKNADFQYIGGNFYFARYNDDWSGGQTLMTITNGGNIGIGTTTPQHLLHVAGTIGAQEVIVSSTGADYVFDPDYKLAPLNEVAAYIRENHHLPDIPSAKEVEQKGLGVGEMQSKLLAKIEELTLHMIAAEDENRELREKVQRLDAILQTLQTAVPERRQPQ